MRVKAFSELYYCYEDKCPVRFHNNPGYFFKIIEEIDEEIECIEKCDDLLLDITFYS